MQLSINPVVLEQHAAQERRDVGQIAERALGRVVSCDGARATIASTVSNAGPHGADSWTIGRMISINLGATRIVALVYGLRALKQVWDEAADNVVHIDVELLGEVGEHPEHGPTFQSGISTYPSIGAIAHRIRHRDLALVHDLGQRAGVAIGSLTQDASVAATVCIDDMLSKHFAVLGTTGVGKSSAVALLMRKAVTARPNLRVLILDPHNEYAHAFPDMAITIEPDTLDLPFWLFRLEEFADVVFRGRPALDDETDILREAVTAARARYRQGSTPDISRDLGSSLLKRPLDAAAARPSSEHVGSGVEAPTPYRMTDLFAVIEELIGLHELRYPRAALRSLKVRLEALYGDPRYHFMFARANMIETMAPVIRTIFRVPLQGRPITVFQLAGLPSEVVNAVTSVLSRLAFDLALASRGGYEILVLCEEAHRYMPADPMLGFAPTRQAIARIAKEGRKYGCYLGVVTQRPGELDPTILSQCSTIFAMRLSNDRDQQIIRSAIAAASASTIGFLSSIGNREALAFGEGVATTMRMRFADMPAHELPSMSGATPRAHGELAADEMVRRMRGG